MSTFVIQTFSPALAKDFIRLNENWIKAYFRLEESDIKTLSNPQKIIDNGGEIFFAVDEATQEAIGCCALIRHTAANWELAKMAVAPDAQSRGIGFQLGMAVIKEARRRSASTLFLEGNTRMKASIHLYRKLGFREVTIEHAAYERCDIKMEIQL